MFQTTSLRPAAPRAGAARARLLLGLLLAAVGFANGAFAQSFLRADGPRIVNASNQEVILNGVNLGNWAVQEGYMMKFGWPGIDGRQTQGTVKKTLYNAGMSDADVETFYRNYRNNFIQKPDLDYIAAQGFNCVRLPLHYDLFLTPAQRAVRDRVFRGTTSYDAYVGELTNWYNTNQLFTDPANMEALRMIDNTLAWAQANQMYVVLDLHAVPGSQGTDANIADLIRPLDLWNRQINQDILNRLWAFVSNRYKNDARVAMYDLINEPNSAPSNQQMNSVYQRLINTIRGQGDNHLLVIEGNGFGNDYNYLEPYTFPNRANLVYNSHRYSGTGYLMDNGVNSTEPGVNNVRFIGNIRNFRTQHNVPIWVGETGENTDAWMRDAARALNSVGVGWCHWTYKRFEDRNNPALLHINPPYIVDGPAGLNQALTNMLFANCVPNTTVGAIAPNQNGLVNYPGGGSYNGGGPPPPAAQAIPGKLEAESYAAMAGVDTEPTTDAGGGRNVDYFETNDWVEYAVNVQTAGSYRVDFRVASAVGNARFELRNSAGTPLGSVSIGNTGGWQNWATVSTTVTLPAGAQRLRVHATASTGCNLNWLNFATATAAFSRQLEAEAASVNNGFVVENCAEGGQNMGFNDDRDYLVWNAVNFPTTGDYLVEYRVASGGGGGTVSCDLDNGNTPLGTTTVPGTGGWQNWTTVSRTVNISAGPHNFGIYSQVGGWNLNWVRISRAASRTALAAAGSPENDAQLSLYPNPAADEVRLALTPALAGRPYRLVNTVGQTVSRGTLGRTLNVRQLPAGLYLLQVTTTDQQTLSRRIVVAR